MTFDKLNFEQIYTEYQPRIHRYLTRIIGAKEAEDLTQEVFIKAGKALGAFRNESQVSTWLYRIATNAAVDRMREASFRRETPVSPIGFDETNPGMFAYADDQKWPSLEESALRKATNECIRLVIYGLPPNYCAPLILSELEGLQNSEIAEILGLSLEVVKARIHRGKERLKKELLNTCQFSRDERNELTCDPKEQAPDKAKSGSL